MSLLLSLLLASPAAPTTTESTAAIDESALAAPTLVAHDDVTERGLDVAVRTVLDAELSAGDRRRLGRKVLSASRVSIVEGSFPGGGTSLVTVNVELRRADPEAAPLFISGAFTLDAAGTLATIVVPPKMRPQRHDLELVGDVDGDGMLDAVLTEIEEGTGVRKLVTWPGGAPTTRVLPPAEHEGC
jgi:hypothetical protein